MGIYPNQSQFYNGEFLNKTHQELKNLVANFATKLGDEGNLNKCILNEENLGDKNVGTDKVSTDKVSWEAFRKRMQNDDIYVLARTPIRFAATRAVWATPTPFINNADDIPVNHKSDIDAWSAVIDALLK